MELCLSCINPMIWKRHYPWLESLIHWGVKQMQLCINFKLGVNPYCQCHIYTGQNLFITVVADVLGHEFVRLSSGNVLSPPNYDTDFLAKFLRCHWSQRQYWFRYLIGAIRQQAITWANVEPDLCCHMVSLVHRYSDKEQWNIRTSPHWSSVW